MTDCANVEVRELLPEHLHDVLDAPTRARVDAHLQTAGAAGASSRCWRAAVRRWRSCRR